MRKNSIRTNPFRIEDGFKILGSVTRTKRIAGKEDLFTLKDVSELLDMPEKDILLLVNHAEIPHINFGGRLFFPLSEIDAVSHGVFNKRLNKIKEEEGIDENATPPFALGAMLLGAALTLAAIFWRRS